MTTAPLTTYATPLSDTAPCGDNLEYDPRMIELDEQYAGEPEHMMGDSLIPAAPPDWRKLEKAASQLMKETRDLRPLVIWTVASLANRGLSGLSEGLTLIAQLSETMWDTLWPVPDDGDVQERISALTRLSPLPGSFDADTTVLQLLLDTPLTDSPALGAYTLKAIRQASDTSDTGRTIRAALQDTPTEHTQALQQELSTCIDLLRNIRDTYATHSMGTPDFSILTDLLKEMQLFLHSAPATTNTTNNAPVSSQPTETTTDSSNSTPNAQPGSTATSQPATTPPLPPATLPTTGNTRQSRQQAIQLMEQLCAWFEENEPSSPVPYFLRRAIRAVGANFLDLITDIAPHAQDQINTILKPQAPATPAANNAPPATTTPTATAPATAAPATDPTPEPGYFSPFG